jgi:hypothetical protein
MANFDYWKSTPDGQRWRREPEPEPKPEIGHCFDCGRRTVREFVSVPVGGGRRYCRECAQWRRQHWLLFDERRRPELEREVA